MPSINHIYGSSTVKNYKGDELSNSTKLRLEALGIDPSSVVTEAQAQLIIAQAEGALNQRGTNNQKQGGNSSREQLIAEAGELALKIGVRVSSQDSLENILKKIAEALNKMAENPNNTDEIEYYRAELTDLARRADMTINVQQNIFNEMEMISLSNRLILGL